MSDVGYFTMVRKPHTYPLGHIIKDRSWKYLTASTTFFMMDSSLYKRDSWWRICLKQLVGKSVGLSYSLSCYAGGLNPDCGMFFSTEYAIYWKFQIHLELIPHVEAVNYRPYPSPLWGS